MIRGILALATLALLISTSAAAQKMYRWVDKDGNVHYSDSVPPEHNDQARERLNDQGVVVEETARAKTKEELAEEAAKLAEAEAYRQQLLEQKRKDDVLRASYTSEEDIQRNRDKKIAGIDRMMAITTASMSSNQKALSKLVNRAADLERAGKPVSDALKSQIDNIRGQIAGQEDQLARREAEKEEAEAQYQFELNRYREMEKRYEVYSSIEGLED